MLYATKVRFLKTRRGNLVRSICWFLCLPGEVEAKRMGESISSAGIARPS